MALIHRAILQPTKLELLTAWLPSQAWAAAAAAGPDAVEQVGSYRFDDPAGEVGLEAHLVECADGTVLHVPLTSRGAPLDGADDALVGTMEHSVLGRRWVYDGCADPVWVAALARAVLAGVPQAEELVDHGDTLVPREPTARVTGTGDEPDPVLDEVAPLSPADDGPATVVRAGDLELVVVREVGTGAIGEHVLTGTWTTGGPATLAAVRPAS